MARTRIKPVEKFFVVGQSSFDVRQVGLPAYSKTHNKIEGIMGWLDTEVWTDKAKEEMVNRFNDVLKHMNLDNFQYHIHEHGGYIFILPGNETAGPGGKPITSCAPNKDRIKFYILCALLAKESSVGPTGKSSKRLIKYRTPVQFLDKLREIEKINS